MKTFIAIPFNQKLTNYCSETYKGHYTATHVVLHGEDGRKELSRSYTCPSRQRSRLCRDDTRDGSAGQGPRLAGSDPAGGPAGKRAG